jgi:ferredoxin-NADP reductase
MAPLDAAAALAPLRVPFWDPETEEELVCRAVRQETADVRSFTFSARAPRRFVYLPGQFITFEVPLPGGAVQRSYTIASTPTRPYSLTITVKRVPGGPVSNWLHDHLQPGMALPASGPLGSFSALLHPAEKYLFLSAGSGITPVMSMARAFADLGDPADILFVHSARSPADLIFRAELAELARGRPNFRTIALCEADSPGESWGGLRGRLDLAALRLIAPDLLERTVFTCGPAPYMAAVRAMLEAAGFDRRRYHEESFDFGAMEAAESPEMVAAVESAAAHLAQVAPLPAAAPAVTGPRSPGPARAPGASAPTATNEDVAGHTITFSKSQRSIVCPPGSTILDAARRAGMRLPSSCAKGVCGTCKSRKIEGSVTMTQAGGIRQREIDQGMILLCCSRPVSDVTVER